MTATDHTLTYGGAGGATIARCSCGRWTSGVCWNTEDVTRAVAAHMRTVDRQREACDGT